jgi:hypothetical protein
MEDYNTATLPSPKYYNLNNFNPIDSFQETASDYKSMEKLLKDDQALLNRKDREKRMTSRDSVNLSEEQIRELRKVEQDRLAVDKLKKLGHTSVGKDIGVRYDYAKVDVGANLSKEYSVQ